MENHTNGDPSGAQRAAVVLAAIDFTDLGDLALDNALAIAAGLNAEAHVVTVAHAAGQDVRFDARDAPRIMAVDEAMTRLATHVRGVIERFQRRARNSHLKGAVSCYIRLGEPAHEIAQLASDLEADTLAIGTHGRSGVKRLLLGSVAERSCDSLRVLSTS